MSHLAVDREDDVILYYQNKEAATAARNRWFRADADGYGDIPDPKATDRQIMDGTFRFVRGRVSMPAVQQSKKKPGMWYWICIK